MNKKTKGILIVGGIILALLVALFIGIRVWGGPKGVAGAKTITVEIIVPDRDAITYTIETDAEFLRGALEQEDLIVGTESEYGLYVLAVDGVKANEANQEWWCFTKGGEQLMTGVDDTPIADGDHFEITLTVGW